MRRSGVGLAMMDLLHRIARLRGLAEVWCQAQITQLTHFTDGRTIPDFAWPRDGKRLAVARMSFTSDILLVKGLRK